MAYKVKKFFRVFPKAGLFLSLVRRRNHYLLRGNGHVIVQGFKKLSRYVHRAVNIDRARAILEDAVQIDFLIVPMRSYQSSPGLMMI